MITSPSPALHIQLLGRPCWRKANGDSGNLTNKSAALLAYVAVAGVVARDTVIDLLWGSAGNMHQMLLNVRRRVDHGIVGLDHVFRLLPDVRCDLADDLASWPLQDLLDRSIFLEGVELSVDCTEFNNWLKARRAEHLANVCTALLTNAHALQEANLLPRALQLAQRLTAQADHAETGWRARMWLLFVAQDLRGAVAAHEQLVQHCTARGRLPAAASQQLWQVVQQGAASARTSVHEQPALLHPPELVGRDTQWATLQHTAARGQPFLLRGEGGIGKSRLLRKFLRQWRRPVIVKCVASDRDAPYAALALLLRTLQDLHELQPGGADRVTLSAVLPHWRTAREPTLTDAESIFGALLRLLQGALNDAQIESIGVDDLHNADAASLEMFRKLNEADPQTLPHLGFAARDATAGPLPAVLDVWRAAALPLKVIDLPPLNPAQVAHLLDTLKRAGLGGAAAAVPASALHAHVGGNPLMLLETLADLPCDWQQGQPLPLPGIALAALAQRIRLVPAAALPLLQVSAVLGPDVAYSMQVLGWPASQFVAQCAVLQTLRVLRADGCFVHDSMLQAALASLDPAISRHWHAVAAALLQHQPLAPPARVAAHWEAAEQWAPAGMGFRAAARLAHDAGRSTDARTLYAQAVACLRRSGQTADEFEALYDSLPIEVLLEDPLPAKALLARLRELAITPHQLACLAHAGALLAVHNYRRGDSALTATTDAVHATMGFRDLYCEALGLHAAALSQCGRFAEALAASEQALTLARADHRSRMLRLIGTYRLYVLYEVSHVDEALALCRELYEAYREAADAVGAAAMQGHEALLLLTVDPALARRPARLALQGHELAHMSTKAPIAVMHRVALAGACNYLGRFDEALAALHDDGQPVGSTTLHGVRAKAQLALAHTWLLLGNDEAALAALDTDDADWPRAMQIQRCWALARAARMRGGDAERHLQRIAVLQAQEPDAALAHCAWLEWARQGDARDVAAQMLHAQQLYEKAGMPGAARSAAVRRIDRLNELADVGDHAAAVDAGMLAQDMQQQLIAGKALHATTYLPEAWLVVAQALGRCGHAQEAATARTAGRRWILDTALPHVHMTWHTSFRQRNPVNCALLLHTD